MRAAIAREWSLLRLACQMLTRIPAAGGVDYAPPLDAASIRYYPFVGVLVGLAGGAVFAAGHAIFGGALAAILAITAMAAVTGGLHEDGLADTADGICGASTAERALEIMRDSRIGAYGVLALILATAAKIFALADLPLWTVAAILIAAHGVSRWSIVLVIATARYVRASGTASPVAGAVSPASHLVAGSTALACLAVVAVVATPAAALGVLAGLALGHVAIRVAFQRKLGGYTGDCLGATQQASEIGTYLGLLACL